MAISDTINSLKTHIGEAYTAIRGKEGTIPANKNCENLKNAIESIPTSGKTQEKTITITKNGSEEVVPDQGMTLSKVTIDTDVVNSVDLNIAYGDVAPANTNKLWVKSASPDIITISSDFAYKNCEETTGAATNNIFSSILDVCDGGYCLYILTSNAIYRMSKTTFECSIVYSVSSATSLCLVNNKIFYLSTHHTEYSSPNPYGDNWQRDQAKLFSYDLSNNTVKEITKVGVVSHYKGKIVAYNGDVYMVGGGDYYRWYSAMSGMSGTEYNQAKVVTIYSPNKNTVKTFAVDTGNTWNSNRVLIGDKIYVFGGALNDAKDAAQNNGIYVIDLSSSTSQKLNATLPIATSKIGVSALGEDIYISGGLKTEGIVYKYNIPTDTIKKIDIALTHNRAACSTFFVGPNLYLAGTNTNIDKVRIFSYLQNSNLKLLCTYKGDKFKFSENLTESISNILGVYKGDENNIAQLVESYAYDGTNWVGLDGTIIFTKLYPPSGVYISGSILHIVNDFRNNGKTITFYVYKGESGSTDHTSGNTIDLSDKTYINVGDNGLRVGARAEGYTESEKSAEVNYYYTIFSVNKKLTNMNSTESDLITIPTNGAASITLTADEGYNLPSYIRVDGADHTWNANTGVAAISNPKQYVLLTASGAPKTWSITPNLNGITAKEGNPTTINTGAEATLGFSVKAGYGDPEKSAIENSVVGATGVWNDSLKTLQLSNPVSNVSFTINALLKTYNINPKLVDVTADASNPTTIMSGETVTLKFTANEGYTLPKAVQIYNVGSYKWDSDKGELIISSPYDPTGTISFTIDCSYNIENHLQNVSSVSGNPSRIKIGGEAELKYQAASGYVLPDSVTVEYATLVSWNKDTGSLKISNPTNTVNITMVGVKDSGIRVTANMNGLNDNITVYDGQSYSSAVNNYSVGNGETVIGIESGYIYIEGDDPNGRVYSGYFQSKPSASGGVTIENWDPDGNYGGGTVVFKVTGPGTIICDFMCMIEGTQITLADGITKAIEDITYDDELLVWNFYDGKFDKAKPTWIKVAEVAQRYNLVKFSNGSEVGFVGAGGEKGYHRIFNKEAGAFTHTGCKDTPNGTTTFAQDGTFPTVVSQEVVEKEVKFYNIITDKHYNLFANGILTSCKLSNKYHIENMRYIGEKLISDEQETAYFERIESKRK